MGKGDGGGGGGGERGHKMGWGDSKVLRVKKIGERKMF